MARRLVLIAARGLDRSTEPISISDSSVAEMVEQMPDAGDAVQLLRGVALSTMRQRAGYIPDCDSRSLEHVVVADAHHEQVAYNSDVVKLLAIIYWGQYSQVYAEWLHWVTLDDRAFPYEAIPMMLSLATRYPHTRGMTKRVIGSRGRWLIDYSGHRGWHWAKHIKPAKRPRLTKYEKLEGRVIGSLANARYKWIPLEANYEMQNMTFPWSRHFSRLVVSTIENGFQSRFVQLTVDDLKRYAELFKWSLHPSQHERILTAYRQRTEKWDDGQQLVTELADLLAFRALLTATFTDDL